MGRGGVKRIYSENCKQALNIKYLLISTYVRTPHSLDMNTTGHMLLCSEPQQVKSVQHKLAENI